MEQLRVSCANVAEIPTFCLTQRYDRLNQIRGPSLGSQWNGSVDLVPAMLENTTCGR